MKAAFSKRPPRIKTSFFPRYLNAPREVSPPPRCFDVTGVRLRTWMEKCRSSAKAPLPPPSSSSSSSYLPASLSDRQPAAHRPAAAASAAAAAAAAARSPVFSHRAPASFFPVCEDLYPGRLASSVASLFLGGRKIQSLRALFSNCPSRHMEKMARPLPINPTFLPPTHGVLKSLLENPLKLPFHHDEGTFFKT